MEMIASFSKNFIFIKTQKTAGTSLEIALSALCSGPDICTTITGQDEILRRDYGSRPLNFCDDKGHEAEFMALVAAGKAKAVQRLRQSGKLQSPFYNHMAATEVRDLLPDLWQSALKITVERHPYERAVSMAWHRSRGSLETLSSAIGRVLATRSFPNYPRYMEGGKVLVDLILDQSLLKQQFPDLLHRLGEKPRDLPNAKGNFRRDRRPANEILTADQKARIYEVTAPEFEVMGYQR